MGCLVGYYIIAKSKTKFLLEKVKEDFGIGQTKSWDDHVVLLRHVLRAIPSYHLMLLSLNKTGYKELEKLCKSFL